MPVETLRHFGKRAVWIRALDLLLRFQSRHGKIEEPPVPIDEIVAFLGFYLVFDDLFALLDLKGYLGCTKIEDREIYIDKSLVDDPKRQGQANFTIAHEVGHIWLHRGIPCPHLIPTDEEPWLERQADWFASYLLMPLGLLNRVWGATFGEPGPLVITPDMEEIGIANLGSRAKLLSYLADKRAGELAPLFTVSREAMRIQLQDFGLLPRW